MGVELLLEPEDISADDLVAIFRAFCESYGIKTNNRDERFLRTQGITALTSEHRFSYRISIGGKFFGEEMTDFTLFWGYARSNDPESELKDRKFQDAVRKYYASKRKSYVLRQY